MSENSYQLKVETLNDDKGRQCTQITAFDVDQTCKMIRVVNDASAGVMRTTMARMLRMLSDAMVERAYEFYGEPSGCYDHRKTDGRGLMRNALNAALNPPAVPEIVVTDEMCDAGFKAYFDMTLPGGKASVTAAYRAMRALEPKLEPAKGAAYSHRDPARPVNDGTTPIKAGETLKVPDRFKVISAPSSLTPGAIKAAAEDILKRAAGLRNGPAVEFWRKTGRVLDERKGPAERRRAGFMTHDELPCLWRTPRPGDQVWHTDMRGSVHTHRRAGDVK